MGDDPRSRVARRDGSPRARRAWLVVLLMTLLMAVSASVLASAGPASALGYPVTYTLTNHTDQTLYLLKAEAGGGCHLAGQAANSPIVCANRDKDIAGRVSPHTVPPGGHAYINGELDLGFRATDRFYVYFGIGPNRQYGTFEVRDTKVTATCHTFNAAPPNDRHYFCTQNSIRGFDLREPPAGLP